MPGVRHSIGQRSARQAEKRTKIAGRRSKRQRGLGEGTKSAARVPGDGGLWETGQPEGGPARVDRVAGGPSTKRKSLSGIKGPRIG